MTELEHIDRLTIIPPAVLPWLLAVGAVVVVWMVATALRDLASGQASRRVPAVSCLSVGGGLLWLVTVKGDRDLADGAAAALIGMLAVLVLWGLYHLGLSRAK